MALKIIENSKLTERELGICLRLRKFREFTRLMQKEFAAQAALSRVTFASYEYGRAPLPYQSGQLICQMFNINQRWLATGQPPMQPFINTGFDYEWALRKRALFSEAYDTVLSPKVEKALQDIAAVCGCSVDDLEGVMGPVPEDRPLLYEMLGEDSHPLDYVAGRYLPNILISRALFLPPELRKHYFTMIAEASKNFLEKHQSEAKSYAAKKRSPAKKKPKSS